MRVPAKRRLDWSPMADALEFRRNVVNGGIEMRETEGTLQFDGFASVYNQPYQVGHFDERVLPSAFDRTMRLNPDVRFLVDHEGQPLARTVSGTLTLDHTNATGYRAQAPLDLANPQVQSLASALTRKDLSQMSFAFRIPQGGDTWDYSTDRPMRTLSEINMQNGDVSVVTYPASEGTFASLRGDTGKQAASWVLADAMLNEVRSGRRFEKDNLRHLEVALDDLGLSVRDLNDAKTLGEALPQLRARPDSFNDIENAVQDALEATYGGDDGDEPFDMWLMDCGADWVVFKAYGDSGPGKGTWRIGYTLNDDGTAALSGDPVKVAIDTSYVPVVEQNSTMPSELAVRLAEADALRHKA